MRELTMKYFFKTRIKQFCLCLVVPLLSLSASAAPTGEVICIHPNRVLEVWSSDVDGDNARQLFRLPLVIMRISLQEEGRYMLVVGERVDRDNFKFDGEDEDNELGVNAYLLDRHHRGKDILFGKDLTLNMYGEVIDASMSPKMDIVFTNSPYADDHFAEGLYLIPKHELNEPIPKAELLFKGPAGSVDFSPNGRNVVFNTEDGIFRLNLVAKSVSKIAQKGFFPVFSPDGKKIAFVTKEGEKRLINIYTLATRKQRVFKVIKGFYINHLTWSGDGKYIAYTLKSVIFQWAISYSNFAASIYGGKPEPILTTFNGGVFLFEWPHKFLSVEPLHLLTATWGQLKARDLK